jgi:hypothetical protein
MRLQLNEVQRLQKIAGILKEYMINEDTSAELQSMIDKNEYLSKQNIKVKPEDLIEGNKFVVLFSKDAADHIKDNHLKGENPGSLFDASVNLQDIVKKLLKITPTEESGGRVKWLGAKVGKVGSMGVSKGDPADVQKMKDYTMPDRSQAKVKIAAGKRKPTDEVSLVTGELGSLSDGRKALSIITMFPGGIKIDGKEIPADREKFASEGLYFVVDPSSPLLDK